MYGKSARICFPLLSLKLNPMGALSLSLSLSLSLYYNHGALLRRYDDHVLIHGGNNDDFGSKYSGGENVGSCSYV